MLQKMTAPKPPLSRVSLRFVPGNSYFIWHPSGPDYCNRVLGYTFQAGRIPGSVPSREAETLQAFGCRVEDYIPGMDIADWNPVESGGFEPKFTTDKPASDHPKVNDSTGGPEEKDDLVITPPTVAEVATPEPVEAAPEPEAEDKPQDYSLLDKDALKALCDKRKLKADRRSVVKMLEALEAGD